MRLLNSRTKVLEDFIGAAPPYAILSHTWEKEEVVFNILSDTNVDHTSMEGWYKIDKSCEQALQDGLDYIWIDTLCIDKSSSAELSEAINSMFKWYRDSAVCYAYLCDIPALDFADSRWFTRGWTLQEMIAPKELKFYDRDWKFVGTKRGLVDQLRQITGVDTTILRGGSVRFMSVSRRMSWAARRKTCREEDMAYCLLGIFDISMPMLYGEGSKAFSRLQEEIVKEYDDQSLFAWKSSTTWNCVGLFAKSPADFADSANIVPCVGRRLEPTTVTSRGLRITAALTRSEDVNLDDGIFLAALSCRSVDFDMEPYKRIALALKRSDGSTHWDLTSTYVRLRPNELFSAQSWNTERTSLYVLKDNYFDDLMGSCVFWVRTMPIWVPGRSFKLAFAHPRERWDEENSLFYADTLSDTQFVLVFCQDYSNGEPTGYFLVFLGFDTRDPDKAANFTGKRRVELWCNTQFHRGQDPKALNLDHPVESRCRYSAHWEQGAGMTLKCYTSIAVVSGQELFCADLHVKALGPGLESTLGCGFPPS
ncbi:HET-domain-containing protein [Hyaloscypha variabilis F]|uniref:HET-domain-containing protein n=1 Tax=Hyaloscypha variabilis (strain UAMH 11265 / GT02V1 / F) TaxID=1149755 RepID=A0A2J6QYS4_HYAVF|nr:HET-domain-containing protein [Hyaloscypha variabilis F]